MTTKPRIALFDIDSTLAHTLDRFTRFEEQYGGRENIDWGAYALAAVDDPPTSVVHLARLLTGADILIGAVSYRPESAREVTLAWAAKNDIDFEVLKLVPEHLTHYRGDEARTHQVEYKIAEVENTMWDYEVVLFVEDQWFIAEAVQEATGVPSLVVSVYPSKIESEQGVFVGEKSF